MKGPVKTLGKVQPQQVDRFASVFLSMHGFARRKKTPLHGFCRQRHGSEGCFPMGTYMYILTGVGLVYGGAEHVGQYPSFYLELTCLGPRILGPMCRCKC